MKKALLGLIVLVLAGVGYAITVNPASNVTADSAATPLTIIYRDSDGDAAVVDLTATTVATSSAATSAFSLTLGGAFTTAQIQAKTPSAAGQLVYNSTLNQVCVSTGATVQGYKVVGTASTTCQ